MYYDLFDHDTSASRTHFVHFAAFTVLMIDLESRLEVICGQWFLQQSKELVWLPISPQ